MKLVYNSIYLSLWCTSTHVHTFVVLVSNLKYLYPGVPVLVIYLAHFCVPVFILQVLQTHIVIFKLKFVYDIKNSTCTVACLILIF